jgi:hypothetical protein
MVKINKNMFAGKIATCNAPRPQKKDLFYNSFSRIFNSSTYIFLEVATNQATKTYTPDHRYSIYMPIYIPYVSICQIYMIATAKMTEK